MFEYIFHAQSADSFSSFIFPFTWDSDELPLTMANVLLGALPEGWTITVTRTTTTVEPVFPAS